jgi:hypothetical protein
MTTTVIFKFCLHVNITHLLAFEFAQEKRRRLNEGLPEEKSSGPLPKRKMLFRLSTKGMDGLIQVKYISADSEKSNENSYGLI